MKTFFVVVPQPESLVLLAQELYDLRLETGTHTAKYFLSNVAKLAGRDYDPTNPGHLLNHLAYSIMVKGSSDEISSIAAETDLAAVKFPKADDGDMLLLLSGNLTSIRSEVLNGCSKSASPFYRQYTTFLLLLLDKQGVGIMFNDFDRKVQNNSLILTERRRR